MAISNALETCIFNELLALLPGKVKWLFIFQSLYDEAFISYDQYFITFITQLSPHLWASCSFRQQFQIHFNEKISKCLQSETFCDGGGCCVNWSSLCSSLSLISWCWPLWIVIRLYKLLLYHSLIMAGLQWE